jgi:hypothetical protein
MEKHEGSFEEALRILFSKKLPAAWRAAWIVESCMEDNDARVKKHVQKIIRLLPLCRDGHQRELLKVLQKIDVLRMRRFALLTRFVL